MMVWFLAFRSLSQRPLRTSLTALGIAVAVAATVIFLSLGEGFRSVFANEISNIGPDLQVSFGSFDATSLTLLPQLPLEYGEQLAAEPDVTEVVPLTLFLRGGFARNTSFLFQGFPADADISTIYQGFEVVVGRVLTEDDAGRQVALIGQQLAEQRELGLGDSVSVNPLNSFDIVGVARSMGGLIDNAVLLPLSSLQDAIGIDDKVSFFALELVEPNRAAEVAVDLGERYPELGFQTRADVLGVIEEGIRISDVMRAGISIIALIVGAISVANTVLMSVFERTREFGVIRAVGAKGGFLFRLVLAESVCLSIVGSAAGVLLGRVGIAIVNSISNDILGFDVAELTLRLLLLAIAIALVIGVLSGLFPAARATRIPIAVALARE
ncbi:MAG: ABC transporter permease [Deinococcota bacterium]